jgi:hypothetical protein
MNVHHALHTEQCSVAVPHTPAVSEGEMREWNEVCCEFNDTVVNWIVDTGMYITYV